MLQVLAQLGWRVVCLAGYTDFCMGGDRLDIPTREMQILYVRELCRIARDLDCRLIRVFTGFDYASSSFDQQWSWWVASLRECARRAAAVAGSAPGNLRSPPCGGPARRFADRRKPTPR